MARRQDWLHALARLVDSGFDPEAPVACPNADRGAVQHRYVVEQVSRVGFAVVWCDKCVEGILVSRAEAPEGATTADLTDPGALDGVPDLIIAAGPQGSP